MSGAYKNQYSLLYLNFSKCDIKTLAQINVTICNSWFLLNEMLQSCGSLKTFILPSQKKHTLHYAENAHDFNLGDGFMILITV